MYKHYLSSIFAALLLICSTASYAMEKNPWINDKNESSDQSSHSAQINNNNATPVTTQASIFTQNYNNFHFTDLPTYDDLVALLTNPSSLKEQAIKKYLKILDPITYSLATKACEQDKYQELTLENLSHLSTVEDICKVLKNHKDLLYTLINPFILSKAQHNTIKDLLKLPNELLHTLLAELFYRNSLDTSLILINLLEQEIVSKEAIEIIINDFSTFIFDCTREESIDPIHTIQEINNTLRLMESFFKDNFANFPDPKKLMQQARNLQQNIEKQYKLIFQLATFKDFNKINNYAFICHNLPNLLRSALQHIEDSIIEFFLTVKNSPHSIGYLLISLQGPEFQLLPPFVREMIINQLNALPQMTTEEIENLVQAMLKKVITDFFKRVSQDDPIIPNPYIIHAQFHLFKNKDQALQRLVNKLLKLHENYFVFNELDDNDQEEEIDKELLLQANVREIRRICTLTFIEQLINSLSLEELKTEIKNHVDKLPAIQRAINTAIANVNAHINDLNNLNPSTEKTKNLIAQCLAHAKLNIKRLEQLYSFLDDNWKIKSLNQ